MMGNIDAHVVDGFGDEWSRFDQSALSEDELSELFDNYFSIFPWENLPENAEGFDLGCGSGRWAKLVAPRVGLLHLIEPSGALEVARKNLAEEGNCRFHRADSESIPLQDASCDFGYSLGVLHHIPDTERALRKCVEKLRPGAPFLLYLYYRFDNRPAWFRSLWRASDIVRRGVSRMPYPLRYALSQVFAGAVYWPLARFSRTAERAGMKVDNWPLSQYRSASFYTMRTDALDRFGTRLEQRFTKDEMEQMMLRCGLRKIKFADKAFWTAVGFREGAAA